MFLEHISVSWGRKKKPKPTKTKPQKQWLVATCQLFFHSVVLMQKAEHKIKEERNIRKEEMIPRGHFNGKAHGTNSWSSKGAQHVRKESSHRDANILKIFAFTSETLLCLPSRWELSPTTPQYTADSHTPGGKSITAIAQVWAYLKLFSWSTQKLCPTPTWSLLEIHSIADYRETLHWLLKRRRSLETIKAGIAALRS